MEKFLELGVDKSIISNFGSQRFSLEWINIQASFLPNYSSTFSTSNKNKCLFFLAGLNYGGNRIKLIKLINELLKLKTINLILCVRPDVIKDLGIDMKKIINNGAIIDYKTPPPSLIDWSDVVINFGSSIVIEAILKKKKVINLMFFQENQTSVFSGLGVAEETNSVDEVLLLIREIDSWRLQIDENVLISFLGIINASVIDGVGKIEFACRKIISLTHNRVNHKKKLKLYNNLAVKASKLI